MLKSWHVVIDREILTAVWVRMKVLRPCGIGACREAAKQDRCVRGIG